MNWHSLELMHFGSKTPLWLKTIALQMAKHHLIQIRPNGLSRSFRCQFSAHKIHCVYTIPLLTLQSTHKMDFIENVSSTNVCSLFNHFCLFFTFLELFAFTCPKVDEQTAATHPRYADPEDCQYVMELLICSVLLLLLLLCIFVIPDSTMAFYSSMCA